MVGSKVILLRVLLLTAGLALLIAATIYADSVDVRYRGIDRTQILTRTLFEYGDEPGTQRAEVELDAVFFGASRTRRAVMEPTLTPILEEKLGRPVEIRDLGGPFAGTDTRFVQIRDLLQRRKVKVIFMEYSLTFEQAGPHPDFFRLATMADILDGPLASDNWLSGMSRRLSMIASKYAVTVAVAGRKLFSELAPTEAHSMERLTPSWTIGEALARSIRLARRDGEYLTPTRLMPNTPAAQRTEHYMRKIISLAEQHKIKLVFWTIPRVYKLDYDELSKKQFKKRYGYSLFSVPDELHKLLRDKSGYYDANHLNRDGADIIQDLLVQLLIEQGGLQRDD